MNVDDLDTAALTLHPQGRVKLAGRLLDSLEELSPGENERIWAEEAQRRADALDAGSLSSRPEDVRRDGRASIWTVPVSFNEPAERDFDDATQTFRAHSRLRTRTPSTPPLRDGC